MYQNQGKLGLILAILVAVFSLTTWAAEKTPLSVFEGEDPFDLEGEFSERLGFVGDEESEATVHGRADFTCSRNAVYLKDKELFLGESKNCTEEVVFSRRQKEGRRSKETFMLSLEHSRTDHDDAINTVFSPTANSLKGVIKIQANNWLKLTGLYYQAEAEDDDDPYRYHAAYANINRDDLPMGVVLGQESDDNSQLYIGYGDQDIGRREDPYSFVVYGGLSQYEQEFRDGSERTDRKAMSALQLNLNEADLSFIIGAGKEFEGGPWSYMAGVHGSLFGDKRNEVLTLCRVRKSRDSRKKVRKTEFCIVHLSFGDERLAGRGRYMKMLGTFFPGLGKSTKIVNGSTLSENGNSVSTASPLSRARWEFVMTRTLVEITDGAELELMSAELSHSFKDLQLKGVHNPYVATDYVSDNSLYFDQEQFVLRSDEPTDEIGLSIGGAFGSRKRPLDTIFRVGYDFDKFNVRLQLSYGFNL